MNGKGGLTAVYNNIRTTVICQLVSASCTAQCGTYASMLAPYVFQNSRTSCIIFAQAFSSHVIGAT